MYTYCHLFWFLFSGASTTTNSRRVVEQGHPPPHGDEAGIDDAATKGKEDNLT